MLGVRLHIGPNPRLTKGTYWVPIVSWDSARFHVKNWLKLFDQESRKGARRPARYITLASIPDSFPVYIASDWCIRRMRNVQFVPLSEIEVAVLDDLKPAKKFIKDFWTSDGMIAFDLNAHPGQPKVDYPEMILGEDLPKSCVKWTKDIRLLYQGDKRREKGQQPFRNDRCE